MPNIHVDLPRGHWCETRDPWEVTEADAKAMRAGLPRPEKKTPANLAGTPPQLAGLTDEGDDGDFAEARGRHVIAWTIAAWGGPLLDDVEITPESIVQIPLPLSSAVAKASNRFWREVRGDADPTEAP